MRHNGHAPLVDAHQIRAAGQVFYRRQGPGHEPSEVLAMKTAHRPPGTDAQLGIEVPEARAVTDDHFAQPGRCRPLVSVAARAVEGYGQGRLVLLLCDRGRLPAGAAGPLDQPPSTIVELAGLGRRRVGRDLGLAIR